MLELILCLAAQVTPNPSNPPNPLTPLTLPEAIRIALDDTPALAEADFVHQRADLATLRAQLDRFSLELNAEIGELFTKSNIGGARGDAASAGLGLSSLSARLTVPLFSGFRVESNVALSKQLKYAAGHDIEQLRRATALSVVRAYLGLVRLGRLRLVEQRALSRIETARATARARVEAGIAPEIDQSRVEARLLLQQVRLTNLEGQLLEAKTQLMPILGIVDETTISDVPLPKRALPTMEVLKKRAAQRPALMAARARLRAQNERVAIARSTYYPQLSAYGLFQYGNNPLLAGAGNRAVFGSVNPFEQMAGDFQVGVTLSINLFDTLKTYTAVKDAQLEAARLTQALNGLLRNVDAELNRARVAVLGAIRLIDRLRPAREMAQDNLQVIHQHYETGEAQLFELLEAELALLNIERDIENTNASLTLAWHELDAASGAVIGDK